MDFRIAKHFVNYDFHVVLGSTEANLIYLKEKVGGYAFSLHELDLVCLTLADNSSASKKRPCLRNEEARLTMAIRVKR